MTRRALALVLVAVLAGACGTQPKSERPPPVSSAGPTTPSFPPAPSGSESPLGAGIPPTVWIGGSLTGVSEASIRLRETRGSVLMLHRLARGATGFFEVAGGAWQRLPDGTPIETGQSACVETLMDKANLLALRVFLGASCGPT
jgi:hypothetical protein